MKSLSLALALCALVVALAAFLWFRSSEPRSARPRDLATSAPAADTHTSDVAMDLATTPNRATASTTSSTPPAEEMHAEATPVAAPSERPNYERVGILLPPHTIEGIVLRGMTPVTAGLAWIARRPASGIDCKGDGPETSDARTVVGTDGVFRFDGVEVGEYCVGVEIDPGVRRVIARSVIVEHPGYRMVFRLGGSAIRGRVFDRAGAPMADVLVRVHSAQPDMAGNAIATAALTSIEGAYAVEGLQPGEYAVAPDLPDERADGVLVDLGVDDERKVDFGSARGSGTWSGRVLAPDGKESPIRATVRIVARDSGTVRGFAPDANGVFHIALTPGSYSLLVSTIGGWSTFDQLDMPPNDLARDVVLPDAWVVVHVRREPGARSNAAFVHLARREGPAGSVMATPGSDGEYHVFGVPPGEYEARLTGATRGPKEPPKTSITVGPHDARVKAEIVVPKE